MIFGGPLQEYSRKSGPDAEALAEYLQFTLERYDPTEDPEWAMLTEHQKEIY